MVFLGCFIWGGSKYFDCGREFELNIIVFIVVKIFLIFWFLGIEKLDLLVEYVLINEKENDVLFLGGSC